MERMSSLRGFGHNITENIKHHLTAIKEKCSGPEKLDLSDPATRKWVGQVTELFYLVDDLLTDAALVQKQRKMMSLFSTWKLKAMLQLKQIKKRLAQEVAPMKIVKMLPNRDAEEEEEAEAVVRDYVKKGIINCILEMEEGVNVRVVVIRGITGMEKGRVAKYVCEDEKVKSGFDVVVWIDGLHLKQHYVEFVVDRVNLELEEKKKKKDYDEGKGFFVVLDDFHNENCEEWLKLVKKLKEVAQARTSSGGGVLLVSTRSEAVLEFVDHSAHKYRFDRLSLSVSLFLFEQIAGTSVSAIESETRDALLEMCGGILGAIETMARLMRSRNPTSDSNLNQLKHEFVQEMLLKYYSELDLPSWRLRQCFAYSFFIFSSHESVKPEKLVRLWIAEGFLGHSSSSSVPEDLGHECIEEFLRRSIFKVNEEGEIFSIFKRGDLAAAVVGNDNVYVKDEVIMDNYVGRVSLSSDLDVSKGIPRSLFKSNKNLRTFVLEKQSRPSNRVMLSWSACDEILSAFTRLRMLTLKDLGMKVLPASIGDLKSLRYLNLSRNNFNKLPICIGELQHLQTLLLSHCLKLKELPDDVNYFASLRHLEVDECPNLTHMPSALKKLTWLRSLPHFVTSKRNGLGELLHLNEVRGDLEISHLERFKFKGSQSARAYLKEKQHLEGLTLRWDINDDDNDDNQYEIVLKQLEPHQNLKRLSIIGYQGNQFPGWLSSLNNLVEISLYKCSKCQSLSTLDHVLVNLEKLTLMSLDSLEFITDNGSKDLRLKQVLISDCPKLTSWWNNPGTHTTTVFSAISESVVEYCPKLVSMPLFPKLDYKLVLDSSNMKPLLNTLRYNSRGPDPSLSKLNHFSMINMDEKQYPREEELLKNFNTLSTLDIKDCKALKIIKGWKHLNSLDILHISNCTGIDLPNDEWEGLKNLNNLIIEDMSDMKSLPEGIKHLTNLDNLEIRSCPKLETVPKEVGEGLNDLTFIHIDDCPKLASLPESLTNNFIGLNIGNCPLLESWNQSRRKLPQPASNIQEEQNLTAQDSTITSHEKLPQQEEQISTAPNSKIRRHDSRRCNHCGSWVIRS